jgi:cyclic pyranopterin phosphate synthase
MKNLKIIDTSILKDWAKEIFTSNNFHMVDVSQKQNTHRKALAMGKIYVGDKTFKLIQNKQMPKGDPISLAEVASLLGVKKTSEIIPLCHPLSVDYSSTKIIQNADDF